jgi:signal transduction histidine kinase
MSSETTDLIELLKAKAILLLQRESELFTLGLARDRTSAWLRAFHGLSKAVESDVAAPVCDEWALLMIHELRLQTAVAYRYRADPGVWSLVGGQSHSPLPSSISLDQDSRDLLAKTPDGLCNQPEGPLSQALSGGLGLNRFLWSLLPAGGYSEHLLLAGFSGDAAASQLPLTPEDLDYFKMLGRHVAVLLRNSHLITELEGERRQLRRMNAQYIEANRELEAFSYSVSHDLRAPLRSIDGFSQALLEDYSDKLDGRAQDYALRVRAAAQRMGELIDDLLQLSRVGRAELTRQPVDLSSLALGVVAELRARDPERRAAVTVQDGVHAHADPHLARIVLDNLLGNAWKFTATNEDAQIQFTAEQQHATWVYSVRDNGAGFDMKYAERLFRPFQRLHSMAEYPGTGIGLATVRRVIDRHRGRVWAESAVGKGACFSFTLASDESGGQP